MAICHPNSEELRTVQDSIDAGRPCVQALIAYNHFLLSHKEPGNDFVRIYNSTVGPLSDHIKLQLSLIYGREARDVRVRFPPVHRQPVGSNLCGPLVCAFMADILEGRSPENSLYCKEAQQRRWPVNMIETEQFTACPKKGAERRPTDALTTAMHEQIVTPADATALRVSLCTGSTRRISNILHKV